MLKRLKKYQNPLENSCSKVIIILITGNIFYMSPLLLHSNTNQYNINGLLCTYAEMLRIQTCCKHILSAAEGFRVRGSRNFCQFYLVLSLFYSLKRGSNGFIAEKTILILYQGSRGGPLYSGGGGGWGVSNFFKGGPNANFYRNQYMYLLFSRGCPEPLSPYLDPHMGNVIITGQYLSQSGF